MTFQYADITFGADPEVFLFDSSKDKFIASCGRIGGTKKNPIPLPKYEKSSIQEDNVAVEFNIVPCKSKSEWVSEISSTLAFLRALVTPKDWSIETSSSVLFSEEELSHPQAQSFGCEPDYNAWTKEENDFVYLSGEKARLRTAGGHVHVGYKGATTEQSLLLGRAMDVFLGVPSIILDKDGEERRELYGKAGAIRFKPYGVEYRTLSNFWLRDTMYTAWVYDQTMKAIRYLNAGGKIDENDSELVQEVINKGKVKEALPLYNKYPII